MVDGVEDEDVNVVGMIVGWMNLVNDILRN